MASKDVTGRLRQSTWNGSIPLEIRLHKGDCRTYDESDPYIIQFPRISYLGLLIHKLHTFFSRSLIYPDVSPKDAWLSYEDVPLKWHYPLGLLYDLYSGAEPAYPPGADVEAAPAHQPEGAEEEHGRLPWRLTVHFSDYPTEQLVQLDNDGKHLNDLFIQSVKEADYLRTGTGKTVMFLSKEDSTQLWEGVKKHEFALYNPINQKLLNPQGVSLRHLPVRLYLPHAATEGVQEETAPGSLRIVQRLVTPSLSSSRCTWLREANTGPGQPQTIGTALNHVLPGLFPSRRSPLLAQAVLHGAALPLGASVEDLVRAAAYLDGWLHIAVVMMG
ncbi:hypothetical protein COCSADRAFT_95423 [Bipolaris sorokiniana ND90Pr]|uniref:Autophagy protein 5 n=1 Tax=Cochliobolus sativus (strain ND90Pr / ATCC 201652) TaxID=665912 RepID=M2SZ27_COCSN|nr:uncharacterized protein COCSADRAFT_95423 [Bipolaris sorokiniana ND90Pr]EMD62042.1 hypothetical protein COCSADRAFT_95423 [Bipolaris sorokiniana ND90Pr]